MSTNGHVVPHADTPDHETHDVAMRDAMREQVSSMRALLDQELATRSHLERLLDESKQRERRLTRAVAALEGDSISATHAVAKPKPQPKAKANDGWAVSDDTVERVWQAFQRYDAEIAHGEPFTMTSLARWMGEQGQGVGGETIRRAFAVLREREHVRKAGTTRGGGVLFTQMPSGQSELSHSEAEHS